MVGVRRFIAIMSVLNIMGFRSHLTESHYFASLTRSPFLSWRYFIDSRMA